MKGEYMCMLDRWNEMSYNKFPSSQSSFQRSNYEQWCDYIDDINEVIAEQEEREYSAWIRKADTSVFVGYGLLL
jgi:hypothetical protein